MNWKQIIKTLPIVAVGNAVMAAGIVLFILSYVIPFFIIFRALSIILLLVGLGERLFIKSEEDD